MNAQPNSSSAPRNNETWIAQLSDEQNNDFGPAVADLRARLRRAVYYYLRHERSDLSKTADHDLQQLAEDLAQDATLRVLENLKSFRGESRFTTWATKIAVRLAISELRRVRYRNFSLEAISARFASDEPANDGAPDDALLPAEMTANVGGRPNPGPEEMLERHEVLSGIQKALDESLTPRQRQAIVAVVFQGVPLEVVAEQLGTNRNALYKLLHDARRKLRANMESQGLSLDYMQRLFGG